MCNKELAFDLSKAAGSTYYARMEGKVIACRFEKLGVQRATIPTDRPHFFGVIVFADGGKDTLHARTLPRIFFTIEDAIKRENCISEMEVCGYHRGLAKHGHHFAEETLANGNKVKVCYVWDEKTMKAVKVIDLPLYDYVNGTFHASSYDFFHENALKVYRSESDCIRDNNEIEVTDFAPESE